MSSSSAKKPNESPERYQFMVELQAKKLAENPMDATARAVLDMYKKAQSRMRELEKHPEWAVHNLEHDLRTSELIIEKCKTSRIYSQNLYCALCNNEFQRLEVMPLLSDERWSCSWRYSGGIIADIREEGDYMDWYCSGINIDYSIQSTADEPMQRATVTEGTVTDEVLADLQKIGWMVIKYEK